MKQEYEETIRSSRYMTTVNWIDLIVQAVSLIYIGIISLLLFVIIALSPQHSQDFRYSLRSQHHYNIEQVNPHVGWTLTINPLIFILKVYLHYKGIIAFRRRNASPMENALIFYVILFIYHTVTIDFFEMGLYGYLAYAAYKLQIAFAGINRHDNVQAQ